ncbi:unnamed protein product [Rotaria magnacalcarata]|uniref:1,4-beta-xylanase n=2 Tax=Rotaria magnacalcarata TaxID=392030 RepID=A0A816ZN26_9BILA|nr:unnamed protein product [Rotaria magnacalcarata]
MLYQHRSEDTNRAVLNLAFDLEAGRLFHHGNIFSGDMAEKKTLDLSIYNANENISYRSGADPAVVKFRNDYYMFVTRSMGYWHSTDLLHWSFITPEKWYFQGSNAPAAHNYNDSVLYVTGDPSGSMSILYTDNPKKGDWKAIPLIINDLQDPDLFIDGDDENNHGWERFGENHGDTALAGYIEGPWLTKYNNMYYMQ